MISWIIIAVFCLLGGYIWGKAVGKESEKAATAAMIPLLLRQQSLEKGYCVLCHRVFRRKIRINPADKAKTSC